MYGFGLTKENLPVFPVFRFTGSVVAPSVYSHELFGINKPSYIAEGGAGSDVNRLNMYTPRWGEKSRGQLPGLSGMVEMVVENDTVREIRRDLPGTVIPQNGYVLAGHGTAGKFLTDNFQVNDPVQVTYTVSPENDNLQAAVGGQALLVKDGKRHWFTQNITGKKARTAIGASQDGKKLYLVVVDAGNTSRGMTQEELADFMVSAGAWTALNLDGGGSSTMVARQLGDQAVSLLNAPVHASERSVPNGIGIFSTAPAGELAGLKITGPKVMLVGTVKQFTAKGYDQHYNPYVVEQGGIGWSVSPELGRFEGAGLKAEKSGSGTIKAVYRGISREYPIRVLGSNDIAGVTVKPPIITAGPGESINFSVTVTTKQGETFVLQPNEYEVQVKGDVGTVSGAKFTAGNSLAVGELSVKIDSTITAVPVTVGKTEKPLYGFETAKNLEFRGYPSEEARGGFRLTRVNEPTFRGAGAARLEYDFINPAPTRAAYGSFTEGLPLPGESFGLGLWVKGDEGNSHWLRVRIVDATGTEKLLDLARNVNWQGWKYVKTDIPAGLKEPVSLTDIYLVETDSKLQDKGVIYIDQLSVISPPGPAEIGSVPPQPVSAVQDIEPGVSTAVKLGSQMEMGFNSPAGSESYTVTAREIWSTDLPTPGYNPLMPIYEITGAAGTAGIDKVSGHMTIELRVPEGTDINRTRVMIWDKEKAVWQQIPGIADAAAGIVRVRTSRLGTLGLMTDSRPLPVFSDIDSSWAKEVISAMAARRIINGYPDGTFLPARGVTRAEFLTLLANTLGWAPETPEAADMSFKDQIPQWALGTIAAAVNRGVVKGYADGTFQPHKKITRAEMAVMIDKALGLEDSSQPSNYGDWRAIPSWAVQPIRNTKVTGLLQGSNNLFRPQDVANRAEATAVTARVLEFYVQQ